MSHSLDMASDPLRPRDWRWLYAQFMSNNRGSKLSKDCKDESILKARAYVGEYKKIMQQTSKPGADSTMLLYPLRGKWPILAQAQAAWTDAKFMRWSIEALVCARVPAADIAKQFGCDTAVIEAYEYYFFDVRDRLDNELWVLNELMSPSVQQGLSFTDWNYFWKALGYWYDVGVLHQFWKLGKLPDDVRQELANYSEDMRLRNVAKAQTVRTINSYNAHEVIDEDISLFKKQEADGDENADTHLLRGANVVLENVIFNIANPSMPLEPIESRELDGGIVEGEFIDIPLPTESVFATRKPTDIKVEAPKDDMTSAKDLVAAQKSAGIEPQVAEAVATEVVKVSLADKKEEILAAIRERKAAQSD